VGGVAYVAVEVTSIMVSFRGGGGGLCCCCWDEDGFVCINGDRPVMNGSACCCCPEEE